MSKADELLVIEDLTKHFVGVRAVHDCSFAVQEGQFVGMIGPNGSGKSTVFNLVSGLLEADTGSVRLAGAELVGKRPNEIARMGIGRTFQTPRAFPSLTLMENLLASVESPGERMSVAFAGTYRRKERELASQAREMLTLVGLSQRATDLCGQLSGGEIRLLEVARQLIRKPRLLLLDEPTAGVNPGLQVRLAELLRTLHDSGLTILVVEHNLHFLLDLAERVVVLTEGSVLTVGTPAEIRSDPKVIAAYLGRDHAA